MFPQDLIVDRLQHSAFRRRFVLKAPEYRYLQEHGLEEVLQHAESFIATRLAPAHPDKDGKQTPFRGHPVFVAQHATATCCRSCLEKWHGIGMGSALTTLQTQHVIDMLARWLQDQKAPVETLRAPRKKSEKILPRTDMSNSRQGVLF
ncbi:DUF4186 domain-containing protein [Herbaspirillum sp. 3R11]|nr:DUF4186 domain-containing protein [Herbaspirillum sp. 3R-3a1]TFI11538.1 DUF4186 domain-containing protein [Herbaspirillum sp. 3R11]TFI17442.1 DUF4186 domain-containing protein [Herbaspirillum sp. 3R-11]TFI31159.1 DUF4186 domain-containing protein [Herbaspirillum sp. 3C11]